LRICRLRTAEKCANSLIRQSANCFGGKGKEFHFFLLVDYPHLTSALSLLPVAGLQDLDYPGSGIADC
jgi:hypothetical protein